MTIQIFIADHTGNTTLEVKISETAQVARLIPQIVNALDLPAIDSAGRPITYSLSYQNHRLKENETLASAAVQEGNTLFVIPEMTAGPGSIPNESINDLLLGRFTALEMGAEASSEQLERVEKILDDLQVAIRKIQLTIGEALIGSSPGESNEVLEVISSQSTHSQELLSQAGEAPKQYSYSTLTSRLEDELRNIFAKPQERDAEPDEMSSLSTLHMRIVDEPLTARNLSIIFTSLNTLYVKCCLIARGQFANLVEYTQTHTDRFAIEANFLITDITHNSPFNFDISLNPENVAKAMQLAIDAVSLTGLRKKEKELVLQAKELDMKLQEQEAQSKVADNEVSRQQVLQEAELERQKKLLELERQQFELEKQRFELHSMRINFALETAQRMVDLLRPGADEATRIMIVNILLPDLLLLGTSRGLQLALPSTQDKQES